MNTHRLTHGLVHTHKHSRVHINTHAHTCSLTHTHTNTHTHTHTHTRARARACAHTHTHTHTHMCVRTFTHTYTHAFIPKLPSQRSLAQTWSMWTWTNGNIYKISKDKGTQINKSMQTRMQPCKMMKFSHPETPCWAYTCLMTNRTLPWAVRLPLCTYGKPFVTIFSSDNQVLLHRCWLLD